MTRRTPLLCLSSMFWDDPTSTPKSIATRLARHYDVLFVEPSVAQIYLRESGRNRRWLRTGRLTRPAPSLHVYSPPPMLPLKSRVPVLNTVSQRWTRPFISRTLRRLGLDRPIVITFLPHSYPILRALAPRLACYYCIDDMGALSRIVDARVVSEYERKLLEQVDIVLTTSLGLRDRLAALHPVVHHLPNGSDPDLYARALDPRTPSAAELDGLARPIIGFSGTTDFRVDQALIREVAGRRPEWSFVFVGPVRTSTARLRALPNVHFVSSQPIDALPGFFRELAAGIIPYHVTGMGASIFPTKLYDYLGAGLPVVSTPLPELAHLPADLVSTAARADGFVEALERVLTRRQPEDVERRVAAARRNGWDARAAAIAELLDAHLHTSSRCGS